MASNDKTVPIEKFLAAALVTGNLKNGETLHGNFNFTLTVEGVKKAFVVENTSMTVVDKDIESLVKEGLLTQTVTPDYSEHIVDIGSCKLKNVITVSGLFQLMSYLAANS